MIFALSLAAPPARTAASFPTPPRGKIRQIDRHVRFRRGWRSWRMGARRACCFVGRSESRRLPLRRQTSLAIVAPGFSVCVHCGYAGHKFAHKSAACSCRGVVWMASRCRSVPSSREVHSCVRGRRGPVLGELMHGVDVWLRWDVR